MMRRVEAGHNRRHGFIMVAVLMIGFTLSLMMLRQWREASLYAALTTERSLYQARASYCRYLLLHVLARLKPHVSFFHSYLQHNDQPLRFDISSMTHILGDRAAPLSPAAGSKVVAAITLSLLSFSAAQKKELALHLCVRLAESNNEWSHEVQCCMAEREGKVDIIML